MIDTLFPSLFPEDANGAGGEVAIEAIDLEGDGEVANVKAAGKFGKMIGSGKGMAGNFSAFLFAAPTGRYIEYLREAEKVMQHRIASVYGILVHGGVPVQLGSAVLLERLKVEIDPATRTKGLVPDERFGYVPDFTFTSYGKEGHKRNYFLAIDTPQRDAILALRKELADLGLQWHKASGRKLGSGAADRAMGVGLAEVSRESLK